MTNVVRLGALPGNGTALPDGGRVPCDDVCRCKKCLALEQGLPPMQQQRGAPECAADHAFDLAVSKAIEGNGAFPDLGLINADRRADRRAPGAE